MVKPILRSGDLFAVHSSGMIGAAIRAVQWVWAWDREAPYNHAGIIISTIGLTLEARLKFKIYSINDYTGQKVLIVRHREMTPGRVAEGLKGLQGEVGRTYPFYRLALFLIPPLAKLSTFARGVCSEQTAKFLCAAGFGNVKYGITPDNLADLWRESKSMDIIFEGVW